MTYIDDIERFAPRGEQETRDRALILDFIRAEGDRALTRESAFAHITSSALVMNRTLDRALMVRHNILGKWAWCGGHADGERDLLAVALREAEEETGVRSASALSDRIASIDILPVPPHRKNGAYVPAHLHLSVAYALTADESDPLAARPGENTGVRWVDVAEIDEARFGAYDVYLYRKLVGAARRFSGAGSP